LTNVTIRDVGIGSKVENMEITSCVLMPGGATGDATITKNLKQSNVATNSEIVSITTLDNDIRERRLPKPDFVKIDIEGMELEALRGSAHTLSECRPALFLEMHGETINLKKKKVNEIIKYLTSVGYKCIEHVETGTKIDQDNSHIAAEGHLYAYRAHDIRVMRNS
jgi:FkbM family methyltransferase